MDPPVRLKRSSTLPPRLNLPNSFVRRASLPVGGVAEVEEEGESSEIYFHPHARIVKFVLPKGLAEAASSSTTASPISAADVDYEIDAVASLPWRTIHESIVALGPMRIEHVKGSTVFLKSGSVAKPLMRNCQCWCVDGWSTFVIRVGRLVYYRLELPGETDDDMQRVETLKQVLSQLIHYEQTPCPFQRGFSVPLAEPKTPKKKKPWRPKVDPTKARSFSFGGHENPNMDLTPGSIGSALDSDASPHQNKESISAEHESPRENRVHLSAATHLGSPFVTPPKRESFDFIMAKFQALPESDESDEAGSESGSKPRSLKTKSKEKVSPIFHPAQASPCPIETHMSEHGHDYQECLSPTGGSTIHEGPELEEKESQQESQDTVNQPDDAIDVLSEQNPRKYAVPVQKASGQVDTREPEKAAVLPFTDEPEKYTEEPVTKPEYSKEQHVPSPTPPEATYTSSREPTTGFDMELEPKSESVTDLDVPESSYQQPSIPAAQVDEPPQSKETEPESLTAASVALSDLQPQRTMEAVKPPSPANARPSPTHFPIDPAPAPASPSPPSTSASASPSPSNPASSIRRHFRIPRHSRSKRDSEKETPSTGSLPSSSHSKSSESSKFSRLAYTPSFSPQNTSTVYAPAENAPATVPQHLTGTILRKTAAVVLQPPVRFMTVLLQLAGRIARPDPEFSGDGLQYENNEGLAYGDNEIGNDFVSLSPKSNRDPFGLGVGLGLEGESNLSGIAKYGRTPGTFGDDEWELD